MNKNYGTCNEFPPENEKEYLLWKQIKLGDAIFSLRYIKPDIAKYLETELSETINITENFQRKKSSAKRDYRKTVFDILCNRDGRKCVLCGSSNDLTIDHKKPISSGGGNEIDNLQLLCRSCNSSKGTKNEGFYG